MDLFFLALTTCMLLFFSGLNWGKSEKQELKDLYKHLEHIQAIKTSYLSGR
jgi:hypothetical protein